MMLKKAFFLLFILPNLLLAQEYPQNYFASPLQIPLALSGTFGELRGNHFHAGVDLKTQGREGLPVLSAADGQVVRIKISAYGYGNALYVAHPNGYTTVYGHLQKLDPAIAEWVKEQQYKKQRFEVDLFPPGGKFTFKQGEEIAKSGNTGGSGGPHLHFEIRDSRTEKTINPAFFGLPIADHKKPVIAHLYAKPISAGAAIFGQAATREIALTHLGNGVFTGKFSGSGMIGLVLNTYDSQDLSNNKNGILSIEQRVNDTTNYRFIIDQFAFNKTRYINAHMDFGLYKTKRQLAHNCYILPGNKLPNYSDVVNQGLIELLPNSNKQITLLVKDSWGNQSEIRLTASGEDAHFSATEETSKQRWNTANSIKIDGVKIYLPAGSLYQDEAIAITQNPACTNCETPVYQIGDRTIPSQNRYNLAIHKNALIKTERLVWATMDDRGNGSGLTTHWDGDWLVAKPREFGQFAVMQDNLDPKVTVQNFANGKITKPGQDIKITATDNLSGITFYEASIDGKWVLLEHDAKRNLYWHTFDFNLAEGSHVITLTFKDEVGNTTTFQSVFTYQH